MLVPVEGMWWTEDRCPPSVGNLMDITYLPYSFRCFWCVRLSLYWLSQTLMWSESLWTLRKGVFTFVQRPWPIVSMSATDNVTVAFCEVTDSKCSSPRRSKPTVLKDWRWILDLTTHIYQTLNLVFSTKVIDFVLPLIFDILLSISHHRLVWVYVHHPTLRPKIEKKCGTEQIYWQKKNVRSGPPKIVTVVSTWVLTWGSQHDKAWQPSTIRNPKSCFGFRIVLGVSRFVQTRTRFK